MEENTWEQQHRWFIHEIRIVPELVAWHTLDVKEWVEEDESPVALITWHLHEIERDPRTDVTDIRTGGPWLASRALLAFWTPTLTIPEWTPAPTTVGSIDELGYDRLIFLPRGERPR